MYNIAIYDDNFAIQEKIISILRLYFEDQFNFITAAKAPDLVASASVIDILIMDINIGNNKRVNGIDIAARIKNNNRDCQIIFVSGYPEYAQDIFDAKPMFFLNKPIEEDAIIRAVKQAVDNISKNRTQRFLYQKESKVYIIPLQEIRYFESSKRIVKLHMVEGATDAFYDTLNEIEKRVDGDFIRIHQSYLVNPRYISALDGNEITLTDNTVLPVSKPRLASVKEELIRIFSEQI
ncbi:MAG: response regulator transcription factor [Clostridiales bacterium]|nr:response regulator transcription factor [Clostridiales bacterium]